jgi:hypothetical protein
MEDVIEHLIHILAEDGYPRCGIVRLKRHTPSGEIYRNCRQLRLEYADDLIIFPLKVKPFRPDLTADEAILSLIN